MFGFRVESRVVDMLNKAKDKDKIYFKALVFFLVGLIIIAITSYIYQENSAMVIILIIPRIAGVVSALYGIYIAYRKWAGV